MTPNEMLSFALGMLAARIVLPLVYSWWAGRNVQKVKPVRNFRYYDE